MAMKTLFWRSQHFPDTIGESDWPWGVWHVTNPIQAWAGGPLDLSKPDTGSASPCRACGGVRRWHLPRSAFMVCGACHQPTRPEIAVWETNEARSVSEPRVDRGAL